MPKIFHPKVLTANDLVDGTSVFMTAEGWSDRISDALIATTPEQAEGLETTGGQSVAENDVIGPYLIDVALDGDAPLPLTRRERIRADGGPSIAYIDAKPVDQAA